METNFDDIRPYNDEEVAPILAQLVEDKEFQEVITLIFPQQDWENMKSMILTVNNLHDFQHSLILDTVMSVVGKSSTSIQCSGFENITTEKHYTYISNHRDIVLDAALLCTLLGRNGYGTAEIAIGDNLLARPWIKDLVRLNKSFIVKRGVGVREMLEVSQHLSQYIHYAIREKNESVWIAQREGRAKDSDDRTQESLLKMLAMGSDADFLTSLKELNITPVTFSYEYDPCDYLKAKEFQQKRDDAEYKKTPADDLFNMQTGIFGNKGNIHFQIGRPIQQELESLNTTLPKNELVAIVKSLIDNEIFRNYKFYPVNYISYNRLFGGNQLAIHYTESDIKIFDSYIKNQIDKIELDNKDIPFLTEKILEMYANPVKNQLGV
jgi:hypothetical protein